MKEILLTKKNMVFLVLLYFHDLTLPPHIFSVQVKSGVCYIK